VLVTRRELTELLRLAYEAVQSGTAAADYELTSETHHRLILDTIERIADRRPATHVVNGVQRSPVSVALSHARRLIAIKKKIFIVVITSDL